MIRKEIFANQQLVNDSIRILEDTVCIYPCILDSAKIYVRNDVLYHYRQCSGSMKRRKDRISEFAVGISNFMERFHKEPEAKLLEKKLNIY